MKTLQEVKAELKEMAVQIRIKKLERSNPKNYSGYVPGLESLRMNYRYQHTAYCMAQGTPYEAIEGKCREDNELYMPSLEKMIAEIEVPVHEEDVCCS